MKFAVKSKVFALFALFAVVVGLSGSAVAGPRKKKKAPAGPPLVSFLPASDAAMTVDAKRVINDAIPQLLGGNKKMLGDVLRTIDEMKAKTGLDARQFNELAVGMSNIKAGASGFDFDVAMLARGTFSSAAMLELAKKSSEFREEKVGDRTILIFSIKKTADAATIGAADKLPDQITDSIDAFVSKEMALTTWDANTLLAGTPARVREAIGATPRMGADLIAMVSRNPSAMMSFGAKLPTGLADFLPLDIDELGESLKGIRELSGWMDVANGMTSLSVDAKTAEQTQAKTLHATLTSLKGFAGLLTGSKRADQKVYGKMIENVKLAQTGNNVSLDLSVPQSDINVILGPK